MTDKHSGNTGSLTDELVNLYTKIFPESKPEIFSMAPGRVNLMGDHTDYNNGFVLPITTEHAVYCVVGEADEGNSRIYSVNFDEYFECSIGRRNFSNEAGAWSKYISGVIQELYAIKTFDQEMNILVYGTVPIGAGLSSSAAIEVSVASALAAKFEIDIETVDLIKLCREVEIKYAGVNCGIMDQFVSKCGEYKHALYLDCESLQYTNIPISFENEVIVIVDTKVKRELATSVYNTRAQECVASVGILQSAGLEIDSLRDVNPDDLEIYRSVLTVPYLSRVRHVVTENQRVKDSVEALIKNDVIRFGELMYASHASLKNDYKVSCDELDFLVKQATLMPQVLGSRMTGGGFGGATVNLVKKKGLDVFIRTIAESYRQQFNIEPGIYIVRENLEATIVYL